MKLVLTCGALHSGLQAAHDLLLRAGLSPRDDAGHAAPHAEAVGWAASHRPGLLEAALEQHPQLHFVLVYSSPAALLATLLDEGEPEQRTVDEGLAAWYAANDDILRFFNRHSARCVLVESSQVQLEPAQVVEHVSRSLGLPLVAPAEPAILQATFADQAARVMAQTLLVGRKDVRSLLMELASQTGIGIASLDATPADALHALAQLRSNRMRSLEQAEELDRLAAERSAAVQAKFEVSAQLDGLSDALALAEEGHRQAVQEATARCQELQQDVEDRQGELDRLNAALREAEDERAALRERQAVGARELAARTAELEAAQRAVAQHQRQHESRAAEAQAVAAELARLDQLAQDAQKREQQAQAERAQLAERAKQLQSTVAALEAQATKLKSDLQAAAVNPALQQQLKQLKDENELLLLQLQQVQDEFDQSHQRCTDMAARESVAAPLLAFMRHQWIGNQPEEIVIDLRQPTACRNWHDAEVDGRWAGPDEVSTIQLPPLRPGLYSVLLDIVDTMEAEILLGMQVSLNGSIVPTEASSAGLPATVFGKVSCLDADRPFWELELRFPRLMRPSDRGEPDGRRLAIRLRSVAIRYVGEA